MRSCFGFFSGEAACQSCALAPKCRSTIITHGFDLAAAMVQELIDTLPEDATFDSTTDIPELVVQLIAGGRRPNAAPPAVPVSTPLGGVNP